MGLVASAQRLLITLLTRPLAGTHNIRIFRFNIPLIVKITERTHSTEAHALRFLQSSGLDIPIPRLICSFVHYGTTYTVMTRVHGSRMMEIVAGLSQTEIETIAGEVWTALQKLQTLRQSPAEAGKVMMSASGHDLPDPADFFEGRSGPYHSVLDLWVHCASCWDLAELRGYADEATLNTMAADPVVYVHPDLRTYNIFVHDGHLSAIIDWEDSGWFPSCWQVHTMRRPRIGCSGRWYRYWQEHRFSYEAEAAYEASKTFLIKFPV